MKTITKLTVFLLFTLTLVNVSQASNQLFTVKGETSRTYFGKRPVTDGPWDHYKKFEVSNFTSTIDLVNQCLDQLKDFIVYIFPENPAHGCSNISALRLSLGNYNRASALEVENYAFFVPCTKNTSRVKMCTGFASIIKKSFPQIPASSDQYKFSMQGYVENYMLFAAKRLQPHRLEINIVAKTKEDLIAQCTNHFEKSGSDFFIDRVDILLNGHTLRKGGNAYSYWENPSEFCNLFVNKKIAINVN